MCRYLLGNICGRFALILGCAISSIAQTTLYNGIVLPQQWPPSQTVSQLYQTPSYITNPPALIPIDIGRQLFVDDFLIQQNTLTRTQHKPVMYPLNPIIVPAAEDTSGYAMPFSGGAWFDPADQLFKMWLFCGGSPAAVCYAYSSDGKNWTRPSIPDAMVPNTDQVLSSGLVVWMDLFDNPSRKFKAFTVVPNGSLPGTILYYYSSDGIHWTATNQSQYAIAIQYDRTTLFYNPFRQVWVDSMKNYTTLPAAASRPSYLSRIRNYSESPDLMNWTPPEPANFGTSFWTGPDVNDPPYVPGGTYPHLYNLDAVAYESVMVGLFSWFYPGFNDENPFNLPGPDLVELGVGFSRDGFQWVRPTRGSGPGVNGGLIPASNAAGTWNMGNTQSAGGCFLVVGDELWFYFSGFNGLHGSSSVQASTGLARLRRDGFYSMDAGSTAGVLTTRPVRFSGKYLFVNVQNPQGSLQVQVLNPANGAVLATSAPVTADKTLQPVSWTNGLADLSAFANQPVQFQFTLTNGSLYAFWVSSSASGASGGYVAAGGPGFTGPIDNLGMGAYSTGVETPEIFPAGGVISSVTPVSLVTGTAGATIYYTLDGTNPTTSSPMYTQPLHLTASATLKAAAFAPGLTASATASAAFTVNNTPPSVAITSPTNGQIVAAQIAISANASDSVSGVASVQFLIDGVAVATDTQAPYTYNLQTTTLTNASHQITAIATNNLGVQATSAAMTVTVQNVTSGPTNGLTGYWSFDSTYVNGTTVFDQSGSNNNAIATGTISVPGEVGQAFQFDGSTAFLQVPFSDSNQTYDLMQDLTLSLWIQTKNSTRYEALISKFAAGGSGSGYLLRTSPAGTLQFLVGATNTGTSTQAATDTSIINDGKWHHVAVVVKLGSYISFYVDGALSSTQALVTIAGAAPTFFEMGVNPYTPLATFFTGLMDEVRFYNRALAASEVSTLYGGSGTSQSPAASVVFLGTDTATQGNWKGVYGQNGAIIANDSNTTPSYATVSFPSAITYTWNASTTDQRALLKGASLTDRIASTYYATAGFTIDLNLTDGQTHQVALYALDWDAAKRSETISVRDAATGITLDQRSITNFSGGTYLAWNVNGHVLINITCTGGTNAVISGVFFSAPVGPDLTILKTHSGNFAPGDTGRVYTITVTNSGGAATNGTVAATDSIPVGLTATAIGGTGWACTQPAGPCSRSDALLPGKSYPAITLTVNVASNAASSVINIAAVSGGGESNTTNDTATDVTTIVAQPSGTSFLTGYALDKPALRNNFSGWVGFVFGVGGNSLSVSSVGRLCVAGNSGSHAIKFVNAATGADVPGSAATLSMSGCVAGQFLYANFANPITLQANTSYILATLESNGGDQWYDHGHVSSTSDAAVTNSVYSFDGTIWAQLAGANTAYVPPNFLYSPILPVMTPVTVQSSQAGASFIVDGSTYTSSQTFQWIAGSSHSVNVASPQSAGTGIQYVWSSWSDGGAISHTVSPSSPTTYTASFATQYQLSSTVSPAASGAIVLSPSSATGYYASGTPVTLTATPSSGCTFVGWSGDLSGSTNPQSVNMTVAHSVTATFQCSGPPTTSFVMSYGQGNPAIRNNFTGWVGLQFTVGSSAVSVTAAGRVCISGNSATHIVKFVNAATGADVTGGSGTVTMLGCSPGTFVYANFNNPVSLSANGSYYLVTQETSGGDQWYDHGAITTTSDASVSNSVYSPDSVTWLPVGTASSSYVPPNFIYSVTPFGVPDLTITKTHSGNFTQGDIGDSYSIVVSNAGTAATSGVVSVSDALPAGLTATAIGGSGWACTQPAGPCSRSDSLSPNNSYSTITVTVNVANNAASPQINSATVSGGGETNRSNDSASDPTTILARISVTVQTSPAGLSFSVDGTSYSTSQAFTWIAGSQHTISTSGTQSGSPGTQFVWTAWSDTGSLSHNVSPATNSTFTASFTPQYFLSSSISPAGGGSVSFNPPSANGYYNSGTSVQVTASTNAGYVFSNWSGDLTGNSNPQSVTMTVPHSITANVQPLVQAVTGYALNGPSLRNNFSGFVGMQFTVGASSLVVGTVGRICAGSNSGTHLVKLVNAGSGADLAGGSASLNLAGCTPGHFSYAQLASPITLQPFTSYLLVSQETAGGDQWYDYGAITTTSDLVVSNSVYGSGSGWTPVASTNTSYVPPSFQYTIGTAATYVPAILSYSGGRLRNDFTGWVGMNFSVGPNNLTVNFLGRLFLAGNTGTHTLKLVNASTGAAVPGGSTTVSMAGGSPGQFSYSMLPNPVVLQANTGYYLVSLEQSGGDQWDDIGPVLPLSSIVVNSSVYSLDGATFIPTSGSNTSYGPLNLK